MELSKPIRQMMETRISLLTTLQLLLIIQTQQKLILQLTQQAKHLNMLETLNNQTHALRIAVPIATSQLHALANIAV